jgi:C1A family cysteine protease
MMQRIITVGTGPQRRTVGTGWLPDMPDIRDRTVRTSTLMAPAADRLAPRGKKKAASLAELPALHDLRDAFPPVEDQGDLGSCTANAAAGLVEYLQLRTYGTYEDLSRLFLYKATRTYLGLAGDTGAYLRSTMGALRLFGAPPERFWPYDPQRFEDEPPAFLYAFASSYRALEYFRLDPPGTAPTEVLQSIKRHIAAGLPAMFGFTVYESIQNSDSGDVAFPTPRERVLGGHAVCVVGYDDEAVITHPTTGQTTTGALAIRNSWGTSWGADGYGRVPYDYVTSGLAEDFWVLVSADFVNLGIFDEQT